MKIFNLISIVSLLFTIKESSATYLPRNLSSITVTNPGFTHFIPNAQDKTKFHLAISTFNGIPLTTDYVFYIRNYDSSSAYKLEQLSSTNLAWPNEIDYIGNSIINQTADPFGGLLVSGGFLVPGKGKGGLFYYAFKTSDRANVTSSAPVVLTADPKDSTAWFYHRTRLVDLNGDGTDDILTCRAYKPIVGTTLTELVGIIIDPKTRQYKLQVIAKSACDVFFDFADIDKDGRFEIVAAGFFINKLNIIYSDDPLNSFTTGAIKVVTIDSNGGKLFEMTIHDLDRSGNLELLVTNHQANSDAIKGAIYYYTLTGTVRQGTWTRTIIYNNFPVLNSGFNQGSPGCAIPFLPNLNDKNQLPYIVSAGDGSQYAYLFEPVLTNNKLSYNLVWKELYKGYTVGGISVADINNDGYSEFTVPIYEGKAVKVYTFAPKV